MYIGDSFNYHVDKNTSEFNKFLNQLKINSSELADIKGRLLGIVISTPNLSDSSIEEYQRNVIHPFYELQELYLQGQKNISPEDFIQKVKKILDFKSISNEAEGKLIQEVMKGDY